MAITIRLSTALRKAIGDLQEINPEGKNVAELLENAGILEKLCSDSGRLRRHISIHINEGEDVRFLEGLETPVNDGDIVRIISAIAGG